MPQNKHKLIYLEVYSDSTSTEDLKKHSYASITDIINI